MRELLVNSGVLKDYDFRLLQLVESGLIRYKDLKDGSVNFYDIVKMLEYERIKGAFTSWQAARQEQERNAKNLRG